MSKNIIYLGLGTNQGDRQQNIVRAIEKLSLALGNPIATAHAIESAPWGYCSPNKYLNTVVAFETTVEPLELLDTTERIEQEMGRTIKSGAGGYSDRIIDIDILFYGNTIIKNERLTIPHPLLHKRTFVLQPLAEIAPHLIHPITKKNTSEMLHCLLKKQTAIKKVKLK